MSGSTKYQKNFSGWNQHKQTIEATTVQDFYVNAGEIWYTKLGVNIGCEEDGKGEGFLRPVLVVNKIGNTFFVIPLTTKGKDNHQYYHTITTAGFDLPSRCILNQGRVIDKKRFLSKIGKLEATEFRSTKKLLKDLYLPGV